MAAAQPTTTKAIEFMDPDNEALKNLFINFTLIGHDFPQRTFWELCETQIKVKGVGLKWVLV